MALEYRYANLGSIKELIILPFAVVSLLSPQLMGWMGHIRSYTVGLALIVLGMLSMFGLLIADYAGPKAITASMMAIAMGVVFPVNLLYPAALLAIEDANSRAAASLNAIRLVYTALALEAVSYIYHGSYRPLGITIITSLAIFLALVATYKPVPLDSERAHIGH